MPLPAYNSTAEPQGPYTDSAPVGVLSSPSLQQKPSLRNWLRVQGACMIVDLHDSKEKKLKKCSYPFLSQQQQPSCKICHKNMPFILTYCDCEEGHYLCLHTYGVKDSSPETR